MPAPVIDDKDKKSETETSLLSSIMESQSSSSSQPSSVPVRFDKVTQYEYFLNEVLRSDLKTTLERREELYNEIAQYMELQTIIEKLKEATGSDKEEDELPALKTRVDIGCNFYVQADVPKTKSIMVDIGCGIWLPMSPKDALKFCAKKLFFLNARVDDLTKKEVDIKAQIKLVLEGLREIQRIGFAKAKERYEF